MSDAHEHLRMVEALLFAADAPLSPAEIAARLPVGADIDRHLETLEKFYAGRGVHLVCVAGRYVLKTAPDLSHLLRHEVETPRRLSRAAVETLAIIAYHQPVTRADIEDLRGVSLSRGTLDILLEAGWVRPAGRRKSPGRPLQFATTEAFLLHFSLNDIKDLPGLAELEAAGLLDSVDQAVEAASADDADPQIDLEDTIADAERRAGRTHFADDPLRDGEGDG